jgi:hypothetical protein
MELSFRNSTFPDLIDYCGCFEGVSSVGVFRVGIEGAIPNGDSRVGKVYYSYLPLGVPAAELVELSNTSVVMISRIPIYFLILGNRLGAKRLGASGCVLISKATSM